MDVRDDRPSGLALGVAAGVLLLIVLLGVGSAVRLTCPFCKGGEVVRVSIGRIPCDLCKEQHRVPATKAAAFRVVQFFR